MTDRATYPDVDKGDVFVCFDCRELIRSTTTRADTIAEAERDGVAELAAALGPDWQIVPICGDCASKRKEGTS